MWLCWLLRTGCFWFTTLLSDSVSISRVCMQNICSLGINTKQQSLNSVERVTLFFALLLWLSHDSETHASFLNSVIAVFSWILGCRQKFVFLFLLSVCNFLPLVIFFFCPSSKPDQTSQTSHLCRPARFPLSQPNGTFSPWNFHLSLFILYYGL